MAITQIDGEYWYLKTGHDSFVWSNVVEGHIIYIDLLRTVVTGLTIRGVA